MALEIEGKLAFIGEREQVGQNNSDKQTFVVSVLNGKYEDDCAFILWKDKCSLLDALRLGDLVKVKFDIRSRDYQGRWYTDLVAWNVKLADDEPRDAEGNSEEYSDAPEDATDPGDPLDEMPF